MIQKKSTLIENKINEIHEEIMSNIYYKDTNPELENLYNSFAYHLSLKGKMLRPSLMITVNHDLMGEFNKIKNFAVALELIHNYSLIHDDLPSMDNDDYRRGQLTVHKKFDEATAILLGDFLLTRAFEYASKDNLENSNPIASLKCINLLAKNASEFGMLGGQILDMNPMSLNSPEMILKMYEYKTSALFKTAFTIPGILNNLNEYENSKLENIGMNFGILFQIRDDISDREEDQFNDKVTIFKYLNLKQVKDLSEELKEKIKVDMNSLDLNYTIDYMDDLYG